MRERPDPGLIPLAYIRNMLAGARARDVPVGPLLRELDLPPDPDALPSGGLAFPLFVRLVRGVTRALDDEYFGLLDRPQRVGTFAIIAAHASHGGTLLGAYERMANFANLLDQSLEHSVTTDRRGAVVCALRKRPRRLLRNELAIETTLVIAHRLVGWMGGFRLPIDGVALAYPRPAHADSYRALFHAAPVTYGAEASSLTIPAVALERAIRRTESQAIAWARRTPLDAFLPLEAVGGLALRVAREVEAGLEHRGRPPSLEELAARLRMAPHQLRRRLKEEGADYLRIRNQTKRDVAIGLLTTTDLPVEEIAQRSGFSAASAFVRAFRGWTGITPRAYRVSAT